ncbi:MAG: ABC transporter ATP-binding protein [Clostridia bacterium]|nr:ABC transporter ATP-binding protein [Clostridia bacterium]
MADTLLRVEGLEKSFDGKRILKGLDFEVGRGEFVTLLGPSGCGKTTTLRIIAGLLEADSGRVLLDGRDITRMPPEKRNVNTVFQNYALFPHMNVEQNISYGLRMRGEKKEVWRKKVSEMLRIVQMEGHEKRMPSQLSGGQCQRIAIARALVLEPELLLLDEPLGALDLKLRRQMQVELKEIQKNLGVAFVYITHDQEEALNMSDRIAVMSEGAFMQVGTPEEIYEHPSGRFVAGFIGQTNILDCKIVSAGENTVLEYAGERFPARNDLPDASAGDAACLCLRQEKISFSREKGENAYLTGKLIEKRYAGGSMRAFIRLNGGDEIQALCSTSDRSGGEAGDTVYLTWNPSETPVVRPDEGAKP